MTFCYSYLLQFWLIYNNVVSKIKEAFYVQRDSIKGTVWPDYIGLKVTNFFSCAQLLRP
jgi:hypothetical protein